MDTTQSTDALPHAGSSTRAQDTAFKTHDIAAIHAERHQRYVFNCPRCETRKQLAASGWQEPDAVRRQCVAGCEIRDARYYRSPDTLYRNSGVYGETVGTAGPCSMFHLTTQTLLSAGTITITGAPSPITLTASS